MFGMGGQGIQGMNLGVGPMNFGFQMQGAANQPYQRKDYNNLVGLYVGNLSHKIYDLDLYRFFNSKGYKIASAKVMYDRDTSKSRGYGYLNFYNEEEAQRCLAEQSNAVIDGKQIVLNKKKDSDFDSKANLLVRNLPRDMDQKSLQGLFSKYGNIKSCKLETFSSGDSRGQGYVQFETQESAQNAIKELNGTEQGGKTIEVLIHTKKDDREDQGESRYTNLFIRHLPQGFKDAQLRDIFKEFGDITSCTMNSKDNGTGFVSYKTHEQAKAAIDGVNMKKKVGDQAILVAPHIYRKENELKPSGHGATNPIVQNLKDSYKSNIFVKFIPKDVTQEQFIAEFSKAGKIASIKLRDQVQSINGETFSNYKIGYVLYENV